MLSIITPAYNEARNLTALYERLVQSTSALAMAWEWVIVDDHSRDETFAVIEGLAANDRRVRGVRLARNSGSHIAITCGLHQAAGDAAVILAADLQDPPEVLETLVERWQHGAQIVWAVRRERPGKRTHGGFAALYYWIMRRVIGMKDMPSRGADFFLVDRVVIDAFRRFPERNVSVLALVTWLGFRQEQVEYDKQPRASGQSGWTMRKKAALVVDSVASFSALPIRLCSFAGLGFLVLSLLVVPLAFLMLPALGAGLLFVLAVMFGLTGLQLLAVGIVGEYVWRALEEARQRPQYLVEAVAGRAEASPAAVE